MRGHNGGMTDVNVTVTQHDDIDRYVMTADDVEVGYLQYADHDGVRETVSTRVYEQFGGRGYGTRLVAAALDDIREAGMTVRPTCPMVDAYLGKHPELESLREG